MYTNPLIQSALLGRLQFVGDPIFDSVESKIASIIFGIPGVKGSEFKR